jgi:16S rRNA (cytosine1402-N4)-methyltransferase
VGDTAGTIVMTYTPEQLHKVLGMYGELKNARTAANAIVTFRAKHTIRTTMDLKTALKDVTPRGKENKYFAQVFQALRIEVNEEMKALEDFLHQCAEVMAPGGRLAIMSYHSLEDRMVKNFINTGKAFGELEKDFYGNPLRPFEAVSRKPIEADEAEVEANNRARSAKLRVAERIKEMEIQAKE